MSLQRSRRAALVAATATILAGGIAFAPAATASNVAWSVSVGGPGFAVSAGQPGYWGGHRENGYGFAHYRPWYRPVAPNVYPAPVDYSYGYVAPRAVVVAPRPVYVRPPVVDYYGYGR